MRSIYEPEPRTFSFPKRTWDLLFKHNIVTPSDGFDATESFVNHITLLHSLVDTEKLKASTSNIVNAFNGAMIARETLLEQLPQASISSQNVFAWLMFHVMLECSTKMTDISSVPTEDMSDMLAALLEILDAPVTDVLKNNL